MVATSRPLSYRWTMRRKSCSRRRRRCHRRSHPHPPRQVSSSAVSNRRKRSKGPTQVQTKRQRTSTLQQNRNQTTTTTLITILKCPSYNRQTATTTTTRVKWSHRRPTTMPHSDKFKCKQVAQCPCRCRWRHRRSRRLFPTHNNRQWDRRTCWAAAAAEVVRTRRKAPTRSFRSRTSCLATSTGPFSSYELRLFLKYFQTTLQMPNLRLATRTGAEDLLGRRPSAVDKQRLPVARSLSAIRLYLLVRVSERTNSKRCP